MAFNQQQLEKQGIYEAKSPLPSLLDDLAQISTLAEQAAAAQKKRSRMGGYTILAGILGAVVGAATGLALLLFVALLAILVGIGLWISSFFKGGNLTAHPVRLETAKQRMTMLLEDAGAKAQFTCRLVLATQPTMLSDEKWSARKNGKQQLFEEGWLSLEGPLLDGTVITDEVKDLTRKRTFSNARGKHKIKTRTTHLVNVRFSYPKELYGDARPAEHALHGEVRVAPSAILRSVRVSDKVIVMKAMVTAEKEIVTTAGMLSVGAYRILNLARRMAVGQRGNVK